MPRLRLTTDARADIRNILRYSKQQWGPEARDDYRALLRTTVERTARFPALGGYDDRLPDGVRIYSVASHRILYRVTGEEVVILRVVHYRQRLPTLEL